MRLIFAGLPFVFNIDCVNSDTNMNTEDTCVTGEELIITLVNRQDYNFAPELDFLHS